MNVLDTFYLLFKSNAVEAEKSIQRMDKSGKELEKGLKDTNREAEKLGQNFVKLVEAGTAAITAYFSFGAIKAGITNAKDFNSALEVQSKIMNQNSQDMLAYGAAVEAAGGSVQGFQSTLQSAFKQAADAGLPLPRVDVLMQRYHDAIKGLSQNEQARRLSLLGVSDPGMISLLEQSDDEFKKSIALAREHAKVTEEDTKAARDFDKQLGLTKQSFQGVFSGIGTDLLPGLSFVIKLFGGAADALRNHSHVAELSLATLSAGGIALSAAISSYLVPALATIGSTAAAALAPVTALLAGVTALTAAIVAHQDIADAIDKTSFGRRIGDFLYGAVGGSPDSSAYGGKRAGSAVGNSSASKQSLDFWISQGFSPAQAAGLVANEQTESGFNPAAIGDNGRARGLFQWHPDRVAKILAETGIDVRVAGREDQLRAAAWELQNSGIADKLKQVTTAEQAGALVSTQFERPANSAAEALRRARLAAQIARTGGGNIPSSFSMGSITGGDTKSINVKVGDISVNTQASDGAGVAKALNDTLENQIRMAVSNMDDGVDS